MRLLLIVPLLLVLAACGGDDSARSSAPSSASRQIPFRTDDSLDLLRNGDVYKTIEIEIAATDSARERGMMERGPLSDDQGMLFVFDHAGPQTFWMASTPSSLDIIFVGSDSSVVSIAKYTRPYSTDAVSGQGAARFVLETAAGFTDRHDVAPGDRLRWGSSGD